MSAILRIVSGRSVSFLCVPLVFLAVAALLALSTTAAYAQSEPTSINPLNEPQDPVPLDKLCVSGLVINHAEEPLEGWTITATYEGVNGDFPSASTVTDAEGKFNFDLPGPGRWALEIESRDRWEGVTTTRLAVHVGFGNRECINVRFKMRESVEVKVRKIDDDHVPQAGWIFTATPGPGNPFGAVQTATTDESGEAAFILTPGKWIISESPPDDVVWWRPISPPRGVYSLEVVGPGPYLLRFKNLIVVKPQGCVNVFKYDVPPETTQESFGLADWRIQLMRSNGTISAEGVTDSFGKISFDNLPYGPYTVREIMQPGWVADSPTSYRIVLTRNDDGCTDIIFYNKQLLKGYCYEGRKVDAVGGFGIPDWEITAAPLEEGGYMPDSVLTDGEGRYRVYLPMDDYRIPGSDYEISETIPDGWSPVSPSSYTITLPEHPDICVHVPDFVNRQTRYTGEPPMMMASNPGSSHRNSYGCRTVHVVRPGESVYKLAGKYNVSARSIFHSNPWIFRQHNRWLYSGQQVCIP